MKLQKMQTNLYWPKASQWLLGKMRGEGLGGGTRKENKKALGYEGYVYSLDCGLVSQEYTRENL